MDDLLAQPTNGHEEGCVCPGCTLLSVSLAVEAGVMEFVGVTEDGEYLFKVSRQEEEE